MGKVIIGSVVTWISGPDLTSTVKVGHLLDQNDGTSEGFQDW